MSGHAILRVARPTYDLDRLIPFYVGGLGFEILTRFKNHAGFDGLILGHKRAPYHLEFTRELGRSSSTTDPPSPEHLVVFYLPEPGAYEAAIQRMQMAGFAAVAANNPYWDDRGRTYTDPDGYRVVLTQREWHLE